MVKETAFQVRGTSMCEGLKELSDWLTPREWCEGEARTAGDSGLCLVLRILVIIIIYLEYHFESQAGLELM